MEYSDYEYQKRNLFSAKMKQKMNEKELQNHIQT